mgnify:CR=1 FL=1
MRKLTNNLRDEWNIFRQKHKKTQSQASLELGWSASLFNQFLCGRRPINSEHIIKISNYFDISPDAIDPQFNAPKRSSIDVLATTSGNPAPSKLKSFLPHAQERFLIWCDISLAVEPGPDCPETHSSSNREALTALGAINEIPAGSSLVCCDPDQTIEASDPSFPIPSLSLWIILQRRGMRALINPIKPKIRANKVARVLAITLA